MPTESRIQMPPRSMRNILASKVMITAENIAYAVFPIAQEMHRLKPDYAIALDRGGRPVGLATHMLYNALYGSLPTADHSIHFTKISRKLPYQTIYDRLRPIAQMAMETQTRPVVYVIDDWTFTGRTKQLITHALSDLSENRIITHFGMLRGFGKNTVGDRFSICGTQWHDKNELVGVQYGSGASKATPLHTTSSIQFRKKISESVKTFAQAAQLPLQ